MTQKQLEDYLWGAANILRGMIDAAEIGKVYYKINDWAMEIFESGKSEVRFVGLERPEVSGRPREFLFRLVA